MSAPTRSQIGPGEAQLALKLVGQAARAVALYSRESVGDRLSGGTPTGGAQATDFDPFAPETLADPYPGYARLLAGPRLHQNRARREWVIAGYDDVLAAARAHDRLSSAEGVTSYPWRIPMVLTTDRPDHTRLRKLVAGGFTRDAMGRWRPAIEQLAGEALDRMLAVDGPADAVGLLAAPLPVSVIGRVLGIDAPDMGRFRDWSDRVVEGFGAELGSGMGSRMSVLGATLQLHAFFKRQFALRRADPGDDMISDLVASDLSQDELFWFAFLLLIAGNETTTNLLGTMLLAFAESPEQFARVKSDPSLIRPAVEEALRRTSPIQGMYRVAVEDYPVGDATVPTGGRVLLLFGAANRDPRHFGDPDRFDVTRNPTDHLAFGTGIHFCLGAHLARLEAEIVLARLADRVERIDLAADPHWRRNPALRGLASLPLRLIPG